MHRKQPAALLREPLCLNWYLPSLPQAHAAQSHLAQTESALSAAQRRVATLQAELDVERAAAKVGAGRETCRRESPLAFRAVLAGK